MKPNNTLYGSKNSKNTPQNPTEFREPPFFEFHIFICQNERTPDSEVGCCFSKGSQDLLRYMKARAKDLNLSNIRINKSGCLGQCSRGPALVIYPQGKWFQIKTFEDIETIFARYILEKKGLAI